MEHTKNKLSKEETIFFEELSSYIDRKLYFFGSIQREDYYKGKSDIDVDIFTDNMTETLVKLQHFLQMDKTKIKHFIWRLNSNNRLVRGNKIMYKSNIEQSPFIVEFSIYDEKIKNDILKEHNSKVILPFYITYLLIILKMFHYSFNIMNRSYYSYIKKKLLSYGIGLPNDEFVILDKKISKI